MTIDFDYSTTGVISPIRDHILVTDMDSEDERVVNGIIIPGETGKDRGIHPRQALVYATGPDQADVKPGDWVFIEHGRWTRGIKLEDGRVYRKVDPAAVLMVSDEKLDAYSENSSVVNTSRHNMGGFE